MVVFHEKTVAWFNTLQQHPRGPVAFASANHINSTNIVIRGAFLGPPEATGGAPFLIVRRHPNLRLAPSTAHGLSSLTLFSIIPPPSKSPFTFVCSSAQTLSFFGVVPTKSIRAPSEQTAFSEDC
jgi:hypothetical protein